MRAVLRAHLLLSSASLYVFVLFRRLSWLVNVSLWSTKILTRPQSMQQCPRSRPKIHCKNHVNLSYNTDVSIGSETEAAKRKEASVCATSSKCQPKVVSVVRVGAVWSMEDGGCRLGRQGWVACMGCLGACACTPDRHACSRSSQPLTFPTFNATQGVRKFDGETSFSCGIAEGRMNFSTFN